MCVAVPAGIHGPRPNGRVVWTVRTDPENDAICLRRARIRLARLHDLQKRLHAGLSCITTGFSRPYGGPTNGRAYATVLRLSSVVVVCDVMYCG